jgi:hypothetical protein
MMPSRCTQSDVHVARCVLLQVREVELSMDMASILRLLDFLEALFNGGSDFNEPLKRCLNRLTDAKWANSDILLVSGAWRYRLCAGYTIDCGCQPTTQALPQQNDGRNVG